MAISHTNLFEHKKYIISYLCDKQLVPVSDNITRSCQHGRKTLKYDLTVGHHNVTYL